MRIVLTKEFFMFRPDWDEPQLIFTKDEIICHKGCLRWRCWLVGEKMRPERRPESDNAVAEYESDKQDRTRKEEDHQRSNTHLP